MCLSNQVRKRRGERQKKKPHMWPTPLRPHMRRGYTFPQESGSEISSETDAISSETYQVDTLLRIRQEEKKKEDL
jgi:hypothetical protein